MKESGALLAVLAVLIIYDVVHVKIGVGYLFLLCTGDYNHNITAF